MIRFILIFGFFAFASASTLVFDQQSPDDDKRQQDDKVEIPDDGNAIARRDFMRTKLMYSQNIFEGLTTGNFKLINAGIKEVSGITEAERWVTIDDERYQKLTEDFKTTVKRLQAAAKTGNIEATALRYYQMSTSCIDCHQHIRIAQYEF